MCISPSLVKKPETIRRGSIKINDSWEMAEIGVGRLKIDETREKIGSSYHPWENTEGRGWSWNLQPGPGTLLADKRELPG